MKEIKINHFKFNIYSAENNKDIDDRHERDEINKRVRYPRTHKKQTIKKKQKSERRKEKRKRKKKTMKPF